MPPVTTQTRVFYSNSWKNSSVNNGKCNFNLSSPQLPRKRRTRNNSKNYSKHQSKKPVKKPAENETARTIYDRDTLLSLRNAPLSNEKLPNLPVIPGITAPRLKKKEMPESLRLKLIKRGVVIRESSSDEDVAEKECKAFQTLSVKEKSFNSDVVWQSCMLHLI